MKKSIIASSLFLLVLVPWTEIAPAVQGGIDAALQKMKITETEATNMIDDLFSYVRDNDDLPNMPAVDILRKLNDRAKAVIAREMVQLAQEYTLTPEFKDSYAKQRERVRPKTPEEYLKEDEANGVNSWRRDENEWIAYYDSLIKKDTVNSLIYARKIDSIRNEFELDSAGVINAREQEYRQGFGAFNERDYLKRDSAWRLDFPEDSRAFVRLRLSKYLELLKTVDFQAKLKRYKDDPGTDYFANLKYEEKSQKWKAIYRAGKSANDAAAKAVREWLKEDK